MSTYKITNISNLAGKRDPKFNSIIDIIYVENMIKKIISVKPNNSVYLTIQSLPMSVHSLRAKGLITVVEIGDSELNNFINAKEERQVEVRKIETEIHEDEMKKQNKKRKE